MVRDDNLDSLVEKLGYSIARVMGMKNRNELEKGLAIIDVALNELVFFDINYLDSVDADALLRTLLDTHKLDVGHVEVVAELLYEQSDILERMNDKSKSNISYLKAMVLFEYIEKTDESLNVDRRHKIERIQEILKG